MEREGGGAMFVWISVSLSCGRIDKQFRCDVREQANSGRVGRMISVRSQSASERAVPTAALVHGIYRHNGDSKVLMARFP